MTDTTLKQLMGMTASEILVRLITVDGIGSNLDADLLDGQQGAFYQNAGNLNAGTLLAARMPALTGDVTMAAGSTATTIATSAVTLAKMANLPANTFIGNNTGGSSPPVAMTGAQAKTLLALVKADVGLGNVENTALSTWAGSSSITTLGTIATGVWNGSTIADTYLPGTMAGKNFTSAVTMQTGTGNKGHEFNADTNTAYHDFHSSSTYIDYDARIQVTAGDGATNGSGTMNLFAAGLNLNSKAVLHAGLSGTYIGGGNLAPNSSFEEQFSSSRPLNWITGGTATGITGGFTASALPNSTNAFQVSCPNAAAGEYIDLSSYNGDGFGYIEAEVGRKYVLSVHAWGTPGMEFRMYVQFLDSGNAVLSTATLPATIITGTYTRYVLATAAAPANTVAMKVYAGRLINNGGTTIPMSLTLDNVMVQEGEMGTFYAPNAFDLNSKKAPLASPAFTGTPTAPTATAGTNTTQLATTAFVQAAMASYTPTLPSNTVTTDGSLQTITGDKTFTGNVIFSGTPGSSNIFADVTSDTASDINGLSCRRKTVTGTSNAVRSGDRVLALLGAGWDGSAYYNAVAIDGYAEEAFTGSTGGASLRFATTATGARARTTRWKIDQSGHFVPFVTNTYNIGSASVRVSTAYITTLDNPALTGTPTAPTATAGTNTTQLATTAFVAAAVAGMAAPSNMVSTDGMGQTITADKVFSGIVTFTTSVPTATFIGMADSDTAGISNNLNFRRKRTTGGAVAAADRLGGVVGQGYYNTTQWNSPVSIEFYTEEAFTATAAGAYMQFSTTAPGTNTRTARWAVTGAGHMTPADTSLAYDLGTSTKRVRTGYFSSLDVSGNLTGPLSWTNNVTMIQMAGGGKIVAGAAGYSVIVRPGVSDATNPGVLALAVQGFDNSVRFSVPEGLSNPVVVAHSSMTVGGNTVLTTASTVDAATLSGAAASMVAGNSTIVQRNASGYVYANYFNTTAAATTASPTAVMVETSSDGFIRKQTLAQLMTNAGAWTSGNFTPTNIPTQTASLLFASGAGNGINFWASNQYCIYMSIATDATWGGRMAGETTSDYNMYFRMTGGTNRGFVFQNGTAEVGGIDGAGNCRVAGSFTGTDFIISSDRRLKTDIRDFEYRGPLAPKNFTMLKTGKADFGFIAQHVRRLYPEAVYRDGDGFLRLSMHKLVTVVSHQANLTDAKLARTDKYVEKLAKENGKLKTEVKTLKSRLARLEKQVAKLAA